MGTSGFVWKLWKSTSSTKMNARKTGCWRWCYRTCPSCMSQEERSAIAAHDEIERSLLEQRKRDRREVKILLLGTAESGKTTFIKQTRIIYGEGFSEEDRRAYAKMVFQNIFTAMKSLTGAMTTLKIPYANPQNEVYGQQIQEVEINQVTHLKRKHVEAIRQLWADGGIKLCYSRRREFQLLDSTEYYMIHLDRIASEDYIPTNQDVLRVRSPTTTITDYSFTMMKVIFRIVDVGGQKGQRRKWIKCFENVTSLIFLASLSEYDQVLEENNNDNRMQESLSLYYTVIHSNWFCNSSVILFLNKLDILTEKIQFSDLRSYFPDFKGKQQDPQDAMKFIRQLYQQGEVCRETKNTKDVYSHFTCATDTDNIRRVFTDVRDVVLPGCTIGFVPY